jgi:hypothetical protein
MKTPSKPCRELKNLFGLGNDKGSRASARFEPTVANGEDTDRQPTPVEREAEPAASALGKKAALLGPLTLRTPVRGLSP